MYHSSSRITMAPQLSESMGEKSSKRARIGPRGIGNRDTGPNVAIRYGGGGSNNGTSSKNRSSTVTAKSNTTSTIDKSGTGLGNHYYHNHTSSTHYFNDYSHHHHNTNNISITVAGNDGTSDRNTRNAGGGSSRIGSLSIPAETPVHPWFPLPYETPQTQACQETKPVSLQVVGDDNSDRSNLPRAVTAERGHHSASASATPLAASGPPPVAVPVPDPIAAPVPSTSSSASTSTKHQPAPGLPTSPVSWYDSPVSMDPAFGGGGEISPVDSVLAEQPPPPPGSHICPPYTSPYPPQTVSIPTPHQIQQDGRSWSRYPLHYVSSRPLMNGNPIATQSFYPGQTSQLDSFPVQAQAPPLQPPSYSPKVGHGESPEVATTASVSSTVPSFHNPHNPAASFDGQEQQQYNPASFDFVVGFDSSTILSHGDFPFGQFSAATTVAPQGYTALGPLGSPGDTVHIDSPQHSSWRAQHQPPRHQHTFRTMEDGGILVNWTHGVPMTNEVVGDGDSHGFIDSAESYVMVHELSDGTCHEEGESSPAESDTMQAKKRKLPHKQRGALEPEKRAQTSATRKMKACVRCRIQKIRCIIDPEDPNMCQTCRNVHMESKKVIHRLPCVRYKLAEMTMFRSNGLALTGRWSDTQCKDLQRESWTPGDDIRIVQVSLGFFEAHHMEFKVRRFNPDPVKWRDVTHRVWRDRNGHLHRTEIAAYALQDVNQTANWYRMYSRHWSHQALEEFCYKISPTGSYHAHQIVRETYLAAKDLSSKAYNDFDATRSRKDDKDMNLAANFMRKYVWLWFAIRNTIGSAFLVGDETLDMMPDPHPDYPYKDIRTHTSLLSIPRMVSEQFNNISFEKVLTPIRKKLLETLEHMMASKDPEHFWVIYLTVFMMLHEVSAMSKDRRRHAQHNQPDVRYTLPGFVEELQEGANILLYHWHYYRRGFHPLTTNMQKIRNKDLWATLNPTQFHLLKRTAETYDELDRSGGSLHLQPEDDLYFVKQMLDENWQHSETFRSTNNCL